MYKVIIALSFLQGFWSLVCLVLSATTGYFSPFFLLLLSLMLVNSVASILLLRQDSGTSLLVASNGMLSVFLIYALLALGLDRLRESPTMPAAMGVLLLLTLLLLVVANVSFERKMKDHD